jgi:hypothetical protein
MAILIKKLKGSTIIEVIVSMIIILSCMGTVLVIFTNISRGFNDELKILAEIRVISIAEQLKNNNDINEREFEFEDMTIRKEILPYNNNLQLAVLYLEAVTPDGRSITEYKEIILKPK